MTLARASAYLCSALLVVGLFLAVSSIAGTAGNPEITDKANDQAVAGQVPISTQPPTGTTVGLNSDILAGWVEETAAGLQLTIKVQGSGTAASSSTTTYTFHLETGGKSYDASATMDMVNEASGVPGSGTIKPGGVATGAVAAGNNLIVLTVPLANVGSPAAGASLTNLFITTQGKSGGAQTTISDRAPDTGAGLPYVMGSAGGATAKKTVYANLAMPRVDITQGFVNKTNALYVYNWTAAPANVTMTLGIHGSGNATVLVRDNANATKFQGGPRNGTLVVNLTGAPGKWRIQVNFTAFKGNVTLSLAPRAAPTPSTGTGTGTSASKTGTSGTSTGTAASKSTTKGTPALGALILLAGMGLVAGLRRRRA